MPSPTERSQTQAEPPSASTRHSISASAPVASSRRSSSTTARSANTREHPCSAGSPPVARAAGVLAPLGGRCTREEQVEGSSEEYLADQRIEEQQEDRMN